MLTKTQYDKYYSDESNIIDTLYSLLPRSPLLFMGCSLSKDYLYDAIEKKARTSDYWNYAILTQPQSSKALINKCNHELVKLKIRPIWFPMNEYDSIITILELLTMKKPYVVHDTKDLLEKFGKNYSEEYQVFVDSNAVEALSDINERNGEHRAELLFSAIMGFNNRCGSSLPKSLEDFTTTINSTQSRNALLIEGAPGIGKSTMLSLLYLVYRKKYPNIYNCYIDLHLYSQESKRDALRPISEYLESIESKLNLFDGVVLFLDGVNEYKRTDSITEKAVSDWIKKHKTSVTSH